MNIKLAGARTFVPARLRTFVRENEIWLVALAAVIGMLAGVFVAGMAWTIQLAHHVLFAVEGHDVSGAERVDPVRAFLVPVVGGVLLGTVGWSISRAKKIRMVDPIEANALHGGQIPTRGSLLIVLQTMLSNGFGASIGLEAAYTQIGSMASSRLGTLFRLRREDMRILVGCGAAGAIAAAFDAPLTGAFYAFELVISAYSIASLAPVVVSSIVATATMRAIFPQSGFQMGFAGSLSGSDLLLVVVMGVVCAAAGIAMMQSVSVAEAAFRRARLPVHVRPAIGGMLVGGLALLTPTVLSSGHSALHVGFGAYYDAATLALLISTKVVASAISIGAGFRGGLFFASLFVGAMIGKLVAIGWMIAFGLQVPGVVIGVLGMTAMATAVVGAPLTMVFLALESTGSLPLSIAVLGASVVSSLTVRKTFGYSFTTWRFHLRGEAIRSAADIGWIRELSVGRLMRRETPTASGDLRVSAFKRAHPPGSAKHVVVVDAAGRYAGLIVLSDVHVSDEADGRTVADIARWRDTVLLPSMNLKPAIKAFAEAEAEALAVVDSLEAAQVLGILTEQHALRRYNEELDRRAGVP